MIGGLLIADSAMLLDPINGSNVRVIECRQDTCFALETCSALRIERDDGGQDFDGDIAAESRVSRPIDLAHPTDAEERSDLERPQPGADRQHATHCKAD